MFFFKAVARPSLACPQLSHFLPRRNQGRNHTLSGSLQWAPCAPKGLPGKPRTDTSYIKQNLKMCFPFGRRWLLQFTSWAHAQKPSQGQNSEKKIAQKHHCHNIKKIKKSGVSWFSGPTWNIGWGRQKCRCIWRKLLGTPKDFRGCLPCFLISYYLETSFSFLQVHCHHCF